MIRIHTLILLFFISFYSHSQTPIQGTIKDLKTKAPIPFCAISIKSTVNGCISNEEGVFLISVESENDSLIFSFIGYKRKIISAGTIQQDREIFLESSNLQLKEVVIYNHSDYLYDAIERCRNTIQQAKPHVAKVYFQLATEIQNQPVEMLECFYNGYTSGASIGNLLLKNGRIGLAESEDKSYFVSLNTSKAISYLNLTGHNDFLPGNPFQFHKSKLKKLYTLNLLSSPEDDRMFHIEFVSRKDTGNFYKGEVWIDKETFVILKINLLIENASIHPFSPLFLEDYYSIANVSMHITQTYTKIDKQSFINSINFNYQLEFKVPDSSRNSFRSVATKQVNTSCIMDFYDYDKPFILPYPEFDTDQSDYRKITCTPYNEKFWKDNHRLLFTDKQNNTLEFFKTNGVVINYNFNNRFKNMGDYHNIFRDNNIIWSEKDRLSLKKNHLDSLLRKEELVNKQSFNSDRYNLKFYIFLDINPAGDSLGHFSATVFDVFESWYNLPEESYTNCFINIYFDLCEIERRKMEKVLSANSFSVRQIDSVYKQTIHAMETQTDLYMKEVQSGKNYREINKWNARIRENLDIDNVSIFGLPKSP